MAGIFDDAFGAEAAWREFYRSLGIKFNSKRKKSNGKRKKKRRHTESTFHRGNFKIDTQVQAAMAELRKKGEHVLAAAKTALKEGVDIIIADAKSRCPVDKGHLKDSIKAISKDDGGTYILTADATNDKNIAYGQFVEFDPRIARPFLYPALDAHREEVNEKVRDAINNAIAAGA